jgi:murein DD-endopeptidase MepM/ murein hydrolase activator NlpD
VILPVSGVLYDIQPGDTLNSIAEKYSVDVNKIISYNIGLSPSKLENRNTIIIPYAKPLKTSYYTSSALPEYPGYFAVPTTGWNWGKLHNYNAVDIANACGTAVYVCAEGLVSEVYTSGWNGGYGKYILVEHPNSTKTLYAHLDKSIVSVGDYVSQGDVIGYIGNTGKTDGVTGCHLHLEVIGAKNPFAK